MFGRFELRVEFLVFYLERLELGFELLLVGLLFESLVEGFGLFLEFLVLLF